MSGHCEKHEFVADWNDDISCYSCGKELDEFVKDAKRHKQTLEDVRDEILNADTDMKLRPWENIKTILDIVEKTLE